MKTSINSMASLVSLPSCSVRLRHHSPRPRELLSPETSAALPPAWSVDFQHKLSVNAPAGMSQPRRKGEGTFSFSSKLRDSERNAAVLRASVGVVGRWFLPFFFLSREIGGCCFVSEAYEPRWCGVVKIMVNELGPIVIGTLPAAAFGRERAS